MTPSRSRNAAGLRGTVPAAVAIAQLRVRRAEQLALDQMADRVRRGDVDLLDQRGFVRRRDQHQIAERVHRRLRVR